jgi:hypothetical protein
MKKKVFTIIYIVITVSAATSLLVSAINYVQFYPALQDVSADIRAQQIPVDSQNRPTQVVAKLAITNPTSYSGLKLEYVVVHLYLTASNNNTLFQSIPLLGSNSTLEILAPGTSFLLRIIFPLIGNQSSALASFLTKYGASIVSHYNVEIHLYTFLDALSPELEIVRDTQYTTG